MGAAEIAHRGVEVLDLQWLRLRGVSAPPAGLHRRAAFCTSDAPQLPEPEWAPDPGAVRAEDLLAGRMDVMGHSWQWSPAPDVWRRAPDTGQVWPQRFFGDIHYRPGNPVGDVRVAWEPSRLQWLVDLALLARESQGDRRERAVRTLEGALLSWISANAPLAGIHYVSAMECALRLIAVCHAVDLARGYLRRRDEVFAAVTLIVATHAALIERRLSLHSSAGNHTVAECAGLAYAGLLFPEMPQASRWKRRGLAILEQEMNRQVLDDGGGIEQTFWYLRFIVDLAALVAALQRQRGESPAPALLDRLGRARHFLGVMAGMTGTLPAVGDADDGYALSRRMAPPWHAPDPAPGIITFPVSGYTVLRTKDDSGLSLLFDHGPLGMAPAFGHGHADALSIILNRGSDEILVDTGTGSYGGESGWRRYFRSTAAHNTICVDDLDQAVQQTAFMWSAPYGAELVRVGDDGGTRRALARHTGYTRCGGVTHWRGVSLHPGGVLLVWDLLDGTGSHRVALHWHVACPVRGDGRRWSLAADSVLEIEGGRAIGCLSAGEQAGGGWRSPAYGRRVPIHTIRVVHDEPLPCEFMSRIVPAGRAVPRDLALEDVAVFRRWMT
jgi:hypothetical protein